MNVLLGKFEPIAGIDGFFQTTSDDADLLALAQRFPTEMSLHPYTIEGEPLLNGLHIVIKDTWIREVTQQHFPEGWRYDRAYILFVGDTFLLWVQKMGSMGSYLDILKEVDLHRFGI